ncbi:MAG: ankyrin repeat domain-containing protein [Candidatus Berkiella sp.]
MSLDENHIEELISLINNKNNEEKLWEKLEQHVGANYKESFKLIDITEFSKILVYTLIGCNLEKSRSAYQFAHRLALAFGKADDAIAYLTQYAKDNQNVKMKSMTEACQFEVPISIDWDVPVWRDVFKRNFLSADFRKSGVVKNVDKLQKKLIDSNQYTLEPQSDTLSENARALQLSLEKHQHELASIQEQLKTLRKSRSLHDSESKMYKDINLQIEDLIVQERAKKKLLVDNNRALQTEIRKHKKSMKKDIQVKTPIQDIHTEALVESALEIVFPKAKQDIAAAKLYNKLKVQEMVFEQWLAVKQTHTRTQSLIPEVVIDGNNAGFKDHYIIKLNDDDPKGPILGEILGCCQSFGKPGENAARYGSTSPNGGFYLLCRGTPPKDGDTKKIQPKQILAEAFVWSTPDNILVLDSVEIRPNIRNVGDNVKKAKRIFYHLAQELTQKHNVTEVRVGTGGATPEGLGYAESTAVMPQGVEPFSDSKNQLEVANRDKPLYSKMALDPIQALKDFEESDDKQKYNIGILARALCFEGTQEHFLELMKMAGVKDIKAFINEHKLVYFAAASKNSDLCHLLLDYEPEVNIIWHDNNSNEIAHFTPLMAACRQGPLSLVKRMIDMGAKLDTKDAWKDTAFSIALHAGRQNIEVIQYLMSLGENLYTTKYSDYYGNVLNTAVGTDNVELAKLCFDLGMKVGSKEYGQGYMGTPMFVANNWDKKDMGMLLVKQWVQEIKQNPASVNDFTGAATAIMMAVKYGMLSETQDLLTLGAEPNLVLPELRNELYNMWSVNYFLMGNANKDVIALIHQFNAFNDQSSIHSFLSLDEIDTIKGYFENPQFRKIAIQKVQRLVDIALANGSLVCAKYLIQFLDEKLKNSYIARCNEIQEAQHNLLELLKVDNSDAFLPAVTLLPQQTKSRLLLPTNESEFIVNIAVKMGAINCVKTLLNDPSYQQQIISSYMPDDLFINAILLPDKALRIDMVAQFLKAKLSFPTIVWNLSQNELLEQNFKTLPLWMQNAMEAGLPPDANIEELNKSSDNKELRKKPMVFSSQIDKTSPTLDSTANDYQHRMLLLALGNAHYDEANRLIADNPSLLNLKCLRLPPFVAKEEGSSISPLAYAVSHGDLKAIKFLIKQGAKIDLNDMNTVQPQVSKDAFTKALDYVKMISSYNKHTTLLAKQLGKLILNGDRDKVRKLLSNIHNDHDEPNSLDFSISVIIHLLSMTQSSTDKYFTATGKDKLISTLLDEKLIWISDIANFSENVRKNGLLSVYPKLKDSQAYQLYDAMVSLKHDENKKPVAIELLDAYFSQIFPIEQQIDIASRMLDKLLLDWSLQSHSNSEQQSDQCAIVGSLVKYGAQYTDHEYLKDIMADTKALDDLVNVSKAKYTYKMG